MNVQIPTDPADIMFENEDLKLYVERGNQIFNLKLKARYPDTLGSRYLEKAGSRYSNIIKSSILS